MKGRKQTPNVIHIATGSRNRRKSEPVHASPLGDPPDVLVGQSLAVWREMVKELSAAGVGARVDAWGLACYCIAVADLEEAEADIRKRGTIVRGKQGMVKNPSCSIKKEAMTQIRHFANEFGLTPAARGKVKATPPPKESKWAALKKKA